MTMLTKDQINTFCLATSANNIGGYEEDATIDAARCNAEEVVSTHDTLADFTAKWGLLYDVEEYSFGKLRLWHGIQVRKGACRGDLMIMDFGDVRAAYFTGEV
jgi:hypothetical protein